MQKLNDNQREKAISKATWVGFGVNVFLSIGKLIAGIVGHSGAMIADAIHSTSDFITDIIVLVFVKISAKPKDEDHDYGHGKYETLATIVIGLMLAGVAIGIFTNNAQRIASFIKGEQLNQPGAIALIAAFVSIVSKEILYWYTVSIANKVESQALKANAWHHRSDAFSSIGTLLGIGGAFFLSEKWRILDPIAAIVVGALIVKVAYDLIIPSLNELLERSLPKEHEDEIESIVMSDNRLSDLHNLKTRRIGACIAIEFHVRVRGDMTVDESHGITKQIEHKLRAQYGDTTQVIIHIEPIK